jgi:hypothetical protein
MGERKRAAAQDQVREQIGFNFGFFAILMPVSAMFAGAVGVTARLVTPLEAVISAGLVVLVFVLLGDDQRWPVVRVVARALVDGTAIVVGRLAPIPVVGTVAYLLGSTIVVWCPTLVLVIVAWLL